MGNWWLQGQRVSTTQVMVVENKDKQAIVSSQQDNPQGSCPSLGSAPRSPCSLHLEVHIPGIIYLESTSEKLYKNKTVSTPVTTIWETRSVICICLTLCVESKVLQHNRAEFTGAPGAGLGRYAGTACAWSRESHGKQRGTQGWGSGVIRKEQEGKRCFRY